MMMNNPAHAGELISEWLDGLKEEGQAITITELAERIQITRPLLSRIINGKARALPLIILESNGRVI